MINKISRIVHVSDIHLRNFKRHEEYRRVFNNLYEYIKNTQDDETLVLLTGDIVHSKTDVTPELYEEVQVFLKTLCDLSPVLLIPGNHDANLNNSNRLDALTPIVNAINNKNLIYFKDSGVITLGEIDFYHWSVFDKKSDYPKCDKSNSSKKICLYHGLVNSATNDFGFVMTSDIMKVSDFNGFDLTLLGDIHTTQYLNEEKTIAYPGSLIQQNHGEGLNHGILVWSLKDNSSEYVQINNDTAYYTIDVENGVYNQLDSNLPYNLYIRIRHKNTSQQELKKIVKEIKEIKNVIELSITKVKDFDIKQKQINHAKGLDFHNVESQNNYISTFLSASYSATESDIKAVCEINTQVNLKLLSKETPRNTIWMPKRFEFENMFGYKKGNHIDFTNMQGTYGIFAPNASGKSTLLDAITYCLFDKCSKTSKAGEVMNNQSTTFKCKFEFELNSTNYTIQRNALIQKSGNVRVEVDFFYIDELGKKVSLNGKDRSETNSNIRKLLGSYEDFILTSFSTQTGNASFIDIGQKERKELLCQFMDLNVFEELYAIANEDAKEVNILLKELEKKDWESEKSIANAKLTESNNLVSANRETKNKILDIYNDIEKETKSIIAMMHNIDSSLIGFDNEEAKRKEKNIEQLIENTENKYKEALALTNKHNSELNELQEQLKGFDVESIQNSIVVLNKLKKSLVDEKIKLKELETEYNANLKKMDKLKDLKYNESCEFCMSNVFVKDAISTKDNIKADEQKLEEKREYIKQIEHNINIYTEEEEKQKLYTQIDNKVNALKMSIMKCDMEIKDISNTKASHLKTLEETRNNIQLYAKQEFAIKENLEYEQKMKEVKSKANKVKEKEKQIDEEYTRLQVEIAMLNNKISECETNLEKIKEYQKSKQLYSYYLESIHRDGIPHNLISQTLPLIEEEVNNILSQLVDFKVVLNADHKNINGYIAYSEERYWGIELVSGMEKFIASLAIRCALISVSSLPRPNFIFIDEGFGALDKENLNSVIALFDYLKTQFQFTAIISHIENMRDMVDAIIEITKENGVSKIQHG